MTGFTHEQLVALKEATAKGVTSLELNGEKVTYRSLDEMFRLIAAIERSMAGDLPRQHYPAFRRE